jgi:hypothetical protein
MHTICPAGRCQLLLLSVSMAAAILFSTSPARAQGFFGWLPRVEAAGTYSYMRANTSGAGGVNLNGASESLAYRFTNHFSGVAEVGQYRFAGLGNGLSSNLYTFVAGARYTRSAFGRTTAFAQILAGGARVNAGSNGIQAGETAFAMAAGGGFNWPIRPHISLRVLQVDYFLTRFENVADTAVLQNHLRISAGIVFQLHGK